MTPVKVLHRPILLNIIALADLVIYPNLFVVNLSTRTVYHGLIHIVQIERLRKKYGDKGAQYFYWNYLRKWWKTGLKYKKIPYELEAYRHETSFKYLERHDPEIWQKIKHLMVPIPPWEHQG